MTNRETKLREVLQKLEDAFCGCDMMKGYACGIHAHIIAIERAALDAKEEPPAHIGWIAGHCSDPLNCPACKESWKPTPQPSRETSAPVPQVKVSHGAPAGTVSNFAETEWTEAPAPPPRDEQPSPSERDKQLAKEILVDLHQSFIQGAKRLDLACLIMLEQKLAQVRREALESLDLALQAGKTRYSRESEPTPAFPVEVVFTMPQWNEVLRILAADLEAAAQLADEWAETGGHIGKVGDHIRALASERKRT